MFTVTPKIKSYKQEANNNSFLLQENTFYLLLEDGTKIVLDFSFNIVVSVEVDRKPKIQNSTNIKTIISD